MRPTGLIGREAELSAALAICAGAEAGHGSVLLVIGEPGIGKSALLGVIGETPGWHVLRTGAVEAESSVAFATLQGLLWPLRDSLDQLDAGQARILRGVIAMGPVEAASTFAVGAATLALLSVSSAEMPLMILVDDAHWADLATQEVLTFVGRRLASERIAMFAAERDRESSLLSEERSFPRMVVTGLAAGNARALLEGGVLENLATNVADALLGICAGNPLGLLELPKSLSAGQRRGAEPLPELIEVGPSIQRAFAARAATVGGAAHRVLLLVAANGGADLELLERVRCRSDSIDAAIAGGLVEERAGAVAFRHPLMQAAVYSAAQPSERRQAHSDLADATAAARRAWHLAEAAPGPDESVALLLVSIAGEVGLAGGLAAEAQALERAAELTPDRELRAQRMLAAARAWRRAGRVNHGFSIAERALSLAGDIRTRAEIQLERGNFLVRSDEPEAAIALLTAEAERAAPTEPKVAAQLLIRAAFPTAAAFNVKSALSMTYRAFTLAGHDGDRPELEAVNALVEHRTEVGLPPDLEDLSLARRAADLLEQAELRSSGDELHWIAYCLALFEFDDRARQLSDLGLSEARASGDVWNLCSGLYARAAIEQVTGRLDTGRPYAIEALALAQEIGETFRFNEASAIMAEIDAARGAREEALKVHDARRAVAIRDPHLPFYQSHLRGWISLAHGEFDDAIGHLETAVRFSRSGAARAWYHMVPLELADAYLSAERKREAEAQITDVAPGIEGSPLVRPKAKLARVRAFAASETRYDSMFGEALSLLDAMPQAFERARTELAWGERLHRSNRKAQAVMHMERALAHFDALGAVGWADRARHELEAATGKVRQARPLRTDALTSQELRIARHAAAGMRDREIAAVLYLSPRTVESYLQSAYRKLEVSNRTQLAAVLAVDGVGPIA